VRGDDNLDIKIGDIVVPREPDDFLFLDPGDIELGEEYIEIFWSGSLGIVVDVINFGNQTNYCRIKLMVDGHMGWTYSDYVEIVNKS